MSTSKIRFISSVGLLVTALIWGFAFVVVKNSLDSIPPIYMLAFRFTIAAIALALILFPRLKLIHKAEWKSGAVLGAFLFVAYALQTIGCQYTTAGKNAFLTTIYVIIVPFLHWIINHKKPDGYALVGAATAIIGIGLLSLQGDSGIQIGDLLTLLCGFGYAIHIVYIDKYTQTQDPAILTVLQLAFAAVFSWILAPIMDGRFPVAAFQPQLVTGMLYLGLLSTMVGFLLQNVCQKYTAPSTASLLLSFESVFGVLFSAIFLKEQMTPRMLIGCLLMFFAIVLVETHFSFLKPRRKNNMRQKARFPMIIRPEEPQDYSQIADITYEAFSDWQERPFRGEPCIVDALRSGQFYDPELALVAEENGRVVGHAFFSFLPAIVLGQERMGAYLTPLTVAPGYQRQGIGRQLLQEGARLTREKGISFIVLCGHPDYYAKFGYRGNAFALQGCTVFIDGSPDPQITERPVRQSDLPWLTRRWKELHMDDRLAFYPGDLAVQWFNHSSHARASVFTKGDTILGYVRYSGNQIKDLVPMEQNAAAILRQIVPRQKIGLPFLAEQARELGLTAQEAVVTSPAFFMLNTTEDSLIEQYLQDEKPGIVIFPSVLDLDE